MPRITPFHLVLVALVLLAGYAAYLSVQNWQLTAKIKEAAPGHHVAISEDEADLTVTIFYDYSCPWCLKIDPIIRQAAREDGSVDLIFKFLPSLGERSDMLARYAYAAGKQDKFLAFHDYLVSRPGLPANEDTMQQAAEELNLDWQRLKEDAESKQAAALLDENMDLAGRVGVRATPTFLADEVLYVPGNELPGPDKFRELFERGRASS